MCDAEAWEGDNITEPSGLYITFSTWEGWEYDGTKRRPRFLSSWLRSENWPSQKMPKHVCEASNLWDAWWSMCMGSLRTVAIVLWCLTVHLWVGSLPSPHSSRPEIKDRWRRNARRLLVSFQSYLDIVDSFYCQKQQEILILGVISPTVAGDELETVKKS